MYICRINVNIPGTTYFLVQLKQRNCHIKKKRKKEKEKEGEKKKRVEKKEEEKEEIKSGDFFLTGSR